MTYQDSDMGKKSTLPQVKIIFLFHWLGGVVQNLIIIANQQAKLILPHWSFK